MPRADRVILVPWRQLADALKERFRGWNISKCKEFRQSLDIHISRALRILEQGLDLGREQNTTAQIDIIQRLDTEMIPGKKELALVRVPQGKGKHPVEALYALFAPLLVGVDDDLRVGSGFKRVPGGLQFFTQLYKIINLTVKNNLQTSVFIADRLGAALHIDNAQPTVSQTDLAINKSTFAIRTSMYL